MNITLNIQADSPEELQKAIHKLTGLRGDPSATYTAAPEQVSQETAPQQHQQPPAQYQQPVPTAVPTTPPPTQQQTQPQGVPTSALNYTMDQLAVASTQLVDAGRREELLQLLASFGAPALMQLPKDQYGAFATKLREMGAKI